MPQSFASLHVHLIFSTKHRLPLITDEIAPRLYDYIGGIFKAEKCALLAAGGIADHIHLLASLSREISIAETMRVVKANSSKWLHEQGTADFLWQSGYAAFAVSFSNINAVKAYIGDQPNHHRVRTFKEELIEFLQRHGIEYDERYMWD